MGGRWPIASDPKLLARIAEQERKRKTGAQGESPTSLLPPKQGVGLPEERGKKSSSDATKRAKKVALNNQDSRLDSMHYDEAANSLTIVLVGAELLSHNLSLRMHNAKTTQLKATWLKRIEALMLTNMKIYDLWKQRATYPLVVEEVYATGENVCLDTESVTAACKPIIDALVRVRFIPDDKPEFIAQPIAYTYRQINKGLVLVLRPAPKPWGEISDATMDCARVMPILP